MDEDVERQRDGNGGKRLGGITGKGFMPGQSGNPAGPKVGTRSVSARLRELLEKNTINGQPIKDGRQVADVVTETILRHALMGDYRFMDMLLNRTEGKVAEPRPTDTRSAADAQSLNEFFSESDGDAGAAPEPEGGDGG